MQLKNHEMSDYTVTIVTPAAVFTHGTYTLVVKSSSVVAMVRDGGQYHKAEYATLEEAAADLGEAWEPLVQLARDWQK